MRFVAIALFCITAFAQDHKAAGDLGKAALGKARAPTTNADSGVPSTQREVLAREVTIFPGTTLYLEWITDLSGSRQVGISVTTLSDLRSTLTDVRFAVAFAAPGDWYIITDVFFGSDFFYSDHGGFTAPVYGPEMKLAISNDGTTPVRITQLVAYAVQH